MRQSGCKEDNHDLHVCRFKRWECALCTSVDLFSGPTLESEAV
jgi:hypothetical protein